MTDVLSDICEVIARYFWQAAATFLLVSGVVGASLLGAADVYYARTLLLYQLGRYYVYVPDTSSRSVRTPDLGDLQQFVNAEMLILNSSQLRTTLIDRLGLANIYPDLAGTPMSGQLAEETLAQAISIKLVTGSYVVDLQVQHRSPDVAARIANTLVDLYMERRAEIFAPAAAAYLQLQIAEAEQQVRNAETEIDELLGGDSIASYVAGREAVVSAQKILRQDIAAIDETLDALSEKDALIMAEIDQIAPALRTPSDPIYQRAEQKLLAIRSNLSALRAERESLSELLEQNGQAILEYARKDSLLEALRGKIDSQREQIAGFYGRLRNTEVAQTLASGGRSSVQIIQPATPPARSTGVPKLVRLIVSILVGAVVAAGWVLVAFLRHQNMLTPSMVRARLNLPVLGEIEERAFAVLPRPQPTVPR